MKNQQGAPEAPTAAQIIARFEREDGYRLEGAVPREWALEAYNELRRLAAMVEAQQPAPSAAAAKPECYRWERYDKWVNGWGWGDCESEYDPRLPENKQYHSEDFNDPEEVRNFRALYRNAPQPSPTPQAASSAVLKAIREANMQLVRTGDDEFMLVTYKNAKAQCDGGQCGIGGYCDDCPMPKADSQPAPDEATAMNRTRDLAESGRWPSDWVEAYRRGYSDRAASTPADSVTAPAGVAYLDIGAGGYIDLGTDLSNEALSRLPKGRHVLIIAGTYGIDGYTPTPPAQAADSVLEDAARLDWLALAGPTSICVVIDRPNDGEVEVATDDVTGYGKTLREALDAARKQGGS